MKVFVTGATGFLGAVLCRQLLEQGYDVCAIRRATSTTLLGDTAAAKIRWVVGDVFDDEALLSGMKGADAVFHCAAYLGFEGTRSKDQIMQVNVQGTAEVVNAALESGISRLVHVSSIAALGRSEDQMGEKDESTEWNRSKLNTAYAVSKHLAEMEVQRGVAEGLDAVIVNPSLIMGPGKPGENTMQIAERLKARTLKFLPTGGTNVVDVEDVAAGMIRALELGKCGERYILSGHNMTWADILGTLSSALQVQPPARRVGKKTFIFLSGVLETVGLLTRTKPLLTRETARVASSLSYYNNSKAVTDLGCTFRPFDETAARIAAVLK
ncbi:MAG: NAD-dependent epimerase/dehydratase family protein [Bacteroidetes bacterium]|nr:NAD-dependent epimerase/dehydratase family protein [Bacteroidota bacterium]